MTLLKTHRFYTSPDRTQSRWIRPIEKEAFYQDWIDTTDLTSDELAAYLMHEEPAEHQLVLPLATA